MNERVKQLFKQEYGYYPAPYELVEAEKFVELIVRECASMARVFHSHGYDFTGDLDLDEFMLKHFGVEQ